MTISLKHLFQSAKGDGADPTQVQPSNWNAEHVLTLASAKLVGRSSPGSGAAEEIPFTTYGASIINAANAAALKALIGSITLADMANMATDRIIGRDTAGSGSPEELTLSQILDFVGSAAQGDILFRGATTWQRLAAGSAGQLLRSGGAGADVSWGSHPAIQVKDISGVGVTVSPTYTTRPLATVEVNEVAGASLASNQLTLPSGTYRYMASMMLYNNAAGDQSGQHRLYNVTDGVEINATQLEVVRGSYYSSQTLFGQFTIASSKAVALQSKINSGALTGIGAVGFKYTDFFVEKVR